MFLRFVRTACMLLFLAALAYGVGTIIAGAWGRLLVTLAFAWLVAWIGGRAHQAIVREQGEPPHELDRGHTERE
jgi:hypothetical protein